MANVLSKDKQIQVIAALAEGCGNAWSHETDNPRSPRTVTVLHVPPITSPRKAVQASIVQAFREAEANAEG
jgi:hypothetical protein